MPKNIILFILTLCWFANCFAQETIALKSKLSNSVTEKYYVLKSDGKTRQGLYQAIYKRKTAVASGNYINGKKTGVWHFYDTTGKLVENFDYTNNTLIYEMPADTTSPLRYVIRIDKKLNDTDRMTQPVKIGGSYYGFLPYIHLFKLPFDLYGFNTGDFNCRIELLISPLGRLADYKVRIVSKAYDYDKAFSMDVNLFNEADKTFIPATFNKEPILSTIYIRCVITNNGGLEFDLE
jgi:hypothetical protein